jgi:asparagine synthase (glutamine-hydrolysing)
MVGTMMHEPFYQSGTCFAAELGVYAGWTAHPTSAAARHSTAQAQKDVSVVLAGECVSDDGEACLTALYGDSGDAFVKGLNGLFSGLVIDRIRRRAVLFNDRYGMERIYVHEAPDAVFFASEAKALLRVVPETRALDDAGVAQLLAFGCTLDWQTLFRGVRLLEGGSWWSFAEGTSRRSRYFVPSDWEAKPLLTERAFEEEFGRTFCKVLPRYLRSTGTGDDIGIALTGGLDTRMIMACLPELASAPVTYTFSGRTEQTLDERIAARVAAARGLPHHILRIGADFLTDYARLLDRTVYVTDGCFGATGTHEIYLNAKARRLAPVRVTGNFGSEVLRSMSTFKPIALSNAMVDADFSRLVAAAGQAADHHAVHPVTFAAFKEIPWSLFGSLAAGRSQTIFRTPYLDNDVVALAYQAPKTSRQAPNAALRLIRDNNPELARLATDRGVTAENPGLGHAMRRVVSEVTFKLDYLHKEGLPHWLMPVDPALGALSRVGMLGWHKYLPFRHWFRHELSRHVTEVLTDPGMSRLGVLNARVLPMIAADHMAGRRNYVREIGAALTLESIDRLLIRGWPSES